MKHWILFGAWLALAAGIGTAAAQEPRKDWARFGRYEQANAELKASGTTPDAVFLGNSITDNWARYDAEFFSRNRFAGRGISGQTTSEMLVRFRQDVIELHPRVVLIMAGTNDIAQNNGYITPEHTLGNIVSMVELARANDIRVILCSVPPAVDFRWRPGLEPAQKIVRRNALIRQYAEEQGVPYLDYWSALADPRGGMPAKWCDDEVHPNLNCYIEVFEPMALEAVNRVLQTRKSYITPLPQQ